MNAKKDGTPGMPDLDRQTREVMSPWFASRTSSPPPPSIMAGVQERVPTTRRRAGWRIADWWLWRRSDGRRAGFVLATAASVLLLSVVGLSSAGVFMVAQVDGPGPSSVQPGAAPASPDHAPTQAEVEATAEPEPATEDSTTAQVEATEAAVAEASEAAAMTAVQTVATDAIGSVMREPTFVSDGNPSTSPEGVTDVRGIETTAVVEFDDERLSGDQRVIRNEYRFGAEGEGSVAAGAITIENAGGSWSGTFESVTPPGRPGALRAAQLKGGGGYEGLTALLHYDLAKDWGDPGMITGVVAPGEPPAYADRGDLDTYADRYKLDDELLTRFKLRDPESRYQENLPAAVKGSMETTIWWQSDDYTLNEEWTVLTLVPEWAAVDLMLDDDRMQLPDYEIALNSFYPDTYDGIVGSLSYGRSRGRTEDGGGWSGVVRGFSSPNEPVDGAGRRFVTTLTGTGAYKGLSAILFNDPNPADPDPPPEEEIHDSWSVEGMLFSGGLPPTPEAP